MGHARLLAVGLALAACANPLDSSENVLPALSADAGEGGADDAGTGGFPAAFRFTCIKIRQLGSVDSEGMQARLLSTTWLQDIRDYKLNILFVVGALDRAGGAATLQVNSGVGPSDDDQCTEPGSVSGTLVATAQDGVVPFEASTDFDEGCLAGEAGSTEEGAAELGLALTPADQVWIHSQDDDGTAFNCTPDPSLPDGVPLRAAHGRFGLSGDGAAAMGEMTGCLTWSEGAALCSCLGRCTAAGPDDVQTEGGCAGCPKGGIPLTSMLAGITSTEHCTELMGEEAFDLRVEFVASRLPGFPVLCE